MSPLPLVERCLVTGASGFVGAALVRRLVAQGRQVHGLVRPASSLWRLTDVLPGMTLHRGDLADGSGLVAVVRAARPQVVFHCAFPHGHPSTAEDRARTLLVACAGILRLVEAAADAGAGCLVRAGSSLEYGPRRHPLRETDRLQPTTFRGAAKAAETILLQQAAAERRLPVITLRLFSVYGQWESPERLIPTAFRAALRGLPLPLTSPGVRHDWVHVDDVAEAFLLAAASRRARGRIINVGTGTQHTNERAVEVVSRVTGRPIEVEVGAYPRRAVDTGYWQADVGRARRLLDWSPRFDLTGGLAATADFYARYPEALDGR